MSSNAKLKYISGIAQRVDDSNGVTYLVIKLTFRVLVIKMSKMAHFLYFLLMTVKNSYSLGKTF